MSGDKIGFKYLANKHVGVFIADKIGWNFGVLSTTVLCTWGLSQKIPGVVPTGKILSNSFSENFSSFYVEMVFWLTCWVNNVILSIYLDQW